MKYTSPHQRVKFVLRLSYSRPVNKEMEVKVPPYRKEIVLYVFQLLIPLQHLYIFKFRLHHAVKTVDKLLSQLECKLVLSEVS